MRRVSLAPVVALGVLLAVSPAGAVLKIEMDSLQTVDYTFEESFAGDAAVVFRSVINSTSGDGDDLLEPFEIENYERAVEERMANEIAQRPRTERTFIDEKPLDISGYSFEVWTHAFMAGEDEPVASSGLIVRSQRWTLEASDLDEAANRHELALTEMNSSALLNVSVPPGWRIVSTHGLVDRLDGPGGSWVLGFPAVDGGTVTVKYGRVAPSDSPLPLVFGLATAVILATALGVFLLRKRRPIDEEE